MLPVNLSAGLHAPASMFWHAYLLIWWSAGCLGALGHCKRRSDHAAQAQVRAQAGTNVQHVELFACMRSARCIPTSALLADKEVAPQALPSSTVLPLAATDASKCPPHAVLPMDKPEVLQQLYGQQFSANVTGTGSVLVIGQHHSGTSMLTRMLMLLGLYAGKTTMLAKSPTNPLKFWELKQVQNLHDNFMRSITTTSDDMSPFCFHGINFTRAPADALQTIGCIIRDVIQDLSIHPAWVTKDPRLLYMSHFWVPQARPTCKSCSYRCMPACVPGSAQIVQDYRVCCVHSLL